MITVCVAGNDTDIYELFGLERYCDPDPRRVREKFNTESLRFHPDKYRGDDEDEKAMLCKVFHALLEGRRTLLDFRLKKKYDRALRKHRGETGKGLSMMEWMTENRRLLVFGAAAVTGLAGPFVVSLAGFKPDGWASGTLFAMAAGALCNGGMAGVQLARKDPDLPSEEFHGEVRRAAIRGAVVSATFNVVAKGVNAWRGTSVATAGQPVTATETGAAAETAAGVAAGEAPVAAGLAHQAIDYVQQTRPCQAMCAFCSSPEFRKFVKEFDPQACDLCDAYMQAYDLPAGEVVTATATAVVEHMVSQAPEGARQALVQAFEAWQSAAGVETYTGVAGAGGSKLAGWVTSVTARTLAVAATAVATGSRHMAEELCAVLQRTDAYNELMRKGLGETPRDMNGSTAVRLLRASPGCAGLAQALETYDPSTEACLRAYSAETDLYKKMNKALLNDAHNETIALLSDDTPDVWHFANYVHNLRIELLNRGKRAGQRGWIRSGTVWRGANLPRKQIGVWTTPGSRFLNAGFMSASKRRDQAEEFAENALLEIDFTGNFGDRGWTYAVDISDISAFPWEEEVLVYPYSGFEVREASLSKDRWHIKLQVLDTQEVEAQVQCPSGHPLYAFSPDAISTCCRCSGPVSAGSRAYRCHECNYDVCKACMVRPT